MKFESVYTKIGKIMDTIFDDPDLLTLFMQQNAEIIELKDKLSKAEASQRMMPFSCPMCGRKLAEGDVKCQD